ncbi:peptidase [Paracoccus sp. M683]|uniref:peptidylprolyl isomerase n=1 Tax=Paracoccus sp. M683 TaxID=2594268 RepID=UPI00117F0399|nr:peptidylprolyl isomerase [Paracoccus sp. M683]TRW96536.1 peptidase [Paracoccus sp. M683]
MAHHPLFPDLVVNGQAVPQALVAAETQHHPAPKGKPGIAWRKAANAMAIRTLLLQEADRRGIIADPAQLAPGRHETDDEARIRALLEAAVTVTRPSEDEIRAEWARDPDRFRAPPLWEVSHILCACDPRDDAASAAAQARALDLTRQALADPAGFARLAATASDCGSKSAGGALGQLGPGDTVPEFESALRALAERQITPEPVLTRHGWHVIRMDGLARGRVLPYETVRDRLADAIEKLAWARAARQFVAQLVDEARINGADLGPA